MEKDDDTTKPADRIPEKPEPEEVSREISLLL